MELLTAAQAEQGQRRVAAGLLDRGLVAGDRVALRTTSGSAMLVAVLGALRVGIIPVVLNAGLLEHERAALLADADAAFEVDDAALAELLAHGREVELAPAPLGRPMHYTSGTTGRAKGVWSGVLTDADAVALLAEERELWGFEPGDLHLVCSPLHHSVAIRFGGGTLLAGGDVLLPGPFDARTVAGAIAEHRPTTTFMVPAHLQRFFALGELPDPRSLRLVAHAGAPCPPALKERAIALFGPDAVWEFYGSTEGQFTVCSADEWRSHPGTVGRARPHRRLTVDDDGVIWCAAPPYAGFDYWRDPDKTAAAWRDEPDGARSFTVRDLGRLDPDGYLHLDGRRDDLIITGGVNVYPAEVEAVLHEVEGVEQVGVFGVDDEQWGQRVCAAVVGTATPEQVQDAARRLLAPYKRPKDVYVVAELPHTSTGKLARLRIAPALGLAGVRSAGSGSSTG